MSDPRGKRILIVDDEEGMRHMLSLLLSRNGYETAEAANGSAALERACAQARLHGQYRLKELKQWLEEPCQQQSFSFLSEHEVIRDLADYGQFVSFEQHN
jgi:CheY-like chemotaxis protein